LQQPTIEESISKPAVASLHQRIPSETPAFPNLHKRIPSDRTITVDDLLHSGPYELEAESNILKALEEHHLQKKPSHERYRSETSTILSGVPDNLAHDFSLDEDSHDPRGRQDNSQESRQTSNDAGHTKESLAEQNKPLLNRERQHRRTMTVEDRLAGLTFAMQSLGQEQRSPADDKQTMDPSWLGSSAEQLGHNAALITRHDLDRQRAANSLPRRASQTSVSDPPPAVRKDEEGISERYSYSDSGDDLEEQLPQDKPQNAASPTGTKTKEATKKRLARKSNSIFSDKLKEDWDTWQSFFRPRKEHILAYVKRVILYFTIPLIGVAAILFYFSDNPPTGKSSDESGGNHASTSWWLLFCLRQVVTLSLSLALQIIVIDFFCIDTRVMLRLLGPLLTLLVAQSKGWSFVVFWWGVFDFSMLYGDGPFAKHWGFWQDVVGLFNEENPSGDIVNSVLNARVLTIAMTVSVAVALKRFTVGLYLGRQTFSKCNSPSFSRKS
jgi:hypothetical protein